MPEATPRSCIQCGAEFFAKRSDARLCSSRCRHDRSLADRGKQPPERLLDKGLKRCGKCEEVKPVADFYWLNGKRKRYQSYCKPCQRRTQIAAARRKRGLPEDAPTPRKEHVPDGSTYTHRGYVMEKRRHHHRADRFGWVYQHILIAEEKYGFPITREYTIHHKNRDKADNRPENLELRVGNHGKGGDPIPSLLADPGMRFIAVEVLREYGYEVTPPASRNPDNPG